MENVVGGQTNQVTGGDIIADALKDYGVRTVACLSGTAHTHLLFAFENRDIAIVSGRHETATIAVADGYARVSGKFGVALIKADQGLPNAMSGILTAQQACSPVVVLVSMLPDPKREAADEWPNDWLDMVKPYVKWARTVPTAARLTEFVHAAVRNARTGRPGVAVLGVPQQFEGEAVDAVVASQPPMTLGPAPNPTAIGAAADLLVEAERPMILAGSGAAWSEAGPVLRELSENMRWPVLANALGRGLVPEDMTLGFSWPLAQVAAKEADVVLVVGMRMTERIGYGLAPRFAPEARFIQIDVDAEEIGRNRTVDVPIVGDARLSLEALRDALKERDAMPRRDVIWVNDALKNRLNRMNELGLDSDAPVHPYRVARDLMDLMPSNAVYVGDGADVQNWMHALLRIRSDRGFIDHYPLGSMGIGTPLAIGAAAAAKDMAEENGEKVERPSDVKPAMERAFQADTFSVVNVLTDPMAGLVRKQDPRVQTIAFEDLVSSLKTHHTPDVA